MFYSRLAMAALLLQAVAAQHPSAQSSAAPPDSQQATSLAERAAVARKAPPPIQLTPEQRGAIKLSQYTNDFFHFQISRPPEWEFRSAGEMNVSEALGRGSMQMKAGITGASTRVFGMHNDTGSNVILSIHPRPADDKRPAEEIIQAMRRNMLAGMPAAKELEENLSLSDAAHKFAGFRYTFMAGKIQLVQSVQVTILNGFAILFTTTSNTDENLSTALTLLSKSLAWKAATP